MASTHGPRALYSRLGDSIAHWEDDALVIETVGLPDADRRRAFPQLLVPGGATVIERLTPISDAKSLYQFTVIDPKTYAAPWLGEILVVSDQTAPLRVLLPPRGNYSLPNILSGARHDEATAKAALVAPAT